MNRYQVVLPESTVWPPIWAETLADATTIAHLQYPMRPDLAVRDDPTPFTCPCCGSTLLVCRNVETGMAIDPATGSYTVTSGVPSGVFFTLTCTSCATRLPISEGQRITYALLLEMAIIGGALARPV